MKGIELLKSKEWSGKIVDCALRFALAGALSGAEMTTRVLSATDPVRNALPPTTECSPITVSPPRMDAPE